MSHTPRWCVGLIARAVVVAFALTMACPLAWADEPQVPLSDGPHDPDPAISLDQATTLQNGLQSWLDLMNRQVKVVGPPMGRNDLPVPSLPGMSENGTISGGAGSEEAGE